MTKWKVAICGEYMKSKLKVWFYVIPFPLVSAEKRNAFPLIYCISSFSKF